MLMGSIYVYHGSIHCISTCQQDMRTCMKVSQEWKIKRNENEKGTKIYKVQQNLEDGEEEKA